MNGINLTNEYYKTLNDAILKMQPYTKDQIIYLYAQLLAENHIDDLFKKEISKRMETKFDTIF